MIKKTIEAFQGGLDVFFNERWFRLYGNGLGVTALLVAKYGAGFTWRQVLVGWLAMAIWNSGSALQRYDEKKRKFQRVQFRIGLTHFRQALIDADIYTDDELNADEKIVLESLGRLSSGYLTFTWLEHGLFFMNDLNCFSREAEATIYLKSFGNRREKLTSRFPGGLDFELQDYLHLRPARSDGGYELVLVRHEDTHDEHGFPNYPSGLTLLRIPLVFLQSLQMSPEQHKYMRAHFDEQEKALESVGLKLWQDTEVSEAWDYRGKYADLHWWTL